MNVRNQNLGRAREPLGCFFVLFALMLFWAAILGLTLWLY